MHTTPIILSTGKFSASLQIFTSNSFWIDKLIIDFGQNWTYGRAGPRRECGGHDGLQVLPFTKCTRSTPSPKFWHPDGFDQKRATIENKLQILMLWGLVNDQLRGKWLYTMKFWQCQYFLIKMFLCQSTSESRLGVIVICILQLGKERRRKRECQRWSSGWCQWGGIYMETKKSFQGIPWCEK